MSRRKPHNQPSGGEPRAEELDHEGEEFQARVLDLAREGGSSEDEVREIEARTLTTAPLIALVGRPNVGKSRLFNRMTGTRFAIVEDMPGVTRDRQYGSGSWDGRRFQVVDTGGFEPDSEDVLLKQMRSQAQLAMDEADIIFFVLDGRAGLMPADEDIARMLRQSRKPVVHIVNKIDGPSQEANTAEFYALGVADIFPLSAEHGYGYGDVLDHVREWLPKEEERAENDGIVRVGVLGKPNAGKSTLVNKLLGTDRLLTSDIPGTTRDAINTWLRIDDKEYLFIDTAGIRRKRSIKEDVERYSVVQSFKAMDRADVVLYVLDAEAGVTNQDQRICGLAVDKGCGLILILNKWDAIKKDHRTIDEYVQRLRDDFKFATFAPIITISALTGQRVHRLFPMIDEVAETRAGRISTSKLNDFVQWAVGKNPPKSRMNQRLKIFYATQVSTRPPTFMFVVNKPELLHFSYERYLHNTFRSHFGFEGTPIKMFYRARKKNEPVEE